MSRPLRQTFPATAAKLAFALDCADPLHPPTFAPPHQRSQILYVTDPDGWTPAATREATRLFASNMNSKMAQRFFNLVLLPAVQA